MDADPVRQAGTVDGRQHVLHEGPIEPESVLPTEYRCKPRFHLPGNGLLEEEEER